MKNNSHIRVEQVNGKNTAALLATLKRGVKRPARNYRQRRFQSRR